MRTRHSSYRYPEAARDWTAAQRESYIFGIQADEHYKLWIAVNRTRAFDAANQAMADGIKRCGSIGAWLNEVTQKDKEARNMLNRIADMPSLLQAAE